MFPLLNSVYSLNRKDDQTIPISISFLSDRACAALATQFARLPVSKIFSLSRTAGVAVSENQSTFIEAPGVSCKAAPALAAEVAASAFPFSSV